MSLWGQIWSEITREYVLQNDEGRYTIRRRKMYAFITIPFALETFMSYGILHCLDSFLFVVTFLPLRFISALLSIFGRTLLRLLGLGSRGSPLCRPAETIDILRGLIILVCVYFMAFFDTSMMYHMIKSQSVIKLYVFYNMLEVGDRLFSAFGQDTIDTLFWTAIQPNKPKKHYIGFIPLAFIALAYAFFHTLLILLQATTLNVAINAANKALLTIMMSNNFVELKSSVFKKFDKKNLFHVSCSDVRERFHLCALLFIVVVQTMKEYGWKEDCFWSLAPECFMIMFVEFVVDWIKHAFITRFNEVSTDVYRDYTTSLAYDLAQSKHKSSSSDHCDWISRKIGFIPLPVGVVIIRVISTSIQVNSLESILLLILAYFSLMSCRILVYVLVMGKGCNLISEHGKKLEEEDSLKAETENDAPFYNESIDPNPKIVDIDKSNYAAAASEDQLGPARIRKRTITGPNPENVMVEASPCTRFVINRSISNPDLIKRNTSEWPESTMPKNT
eukprot:TRINITY_DN4293_c0_g1_i1.p1 TRINITY_DN4293_c0_g1~~TRINITY_DN4293_c0_g1_i1.p1  ORF type:complete len:504 (+),score=59.00 TRINITY_DN4293_c0_g1_i1:269-1780(+)